MRLPHFLTLNLAVADFLSGAYREFNAGARTRVHGACHISCNTIASPTAAAYELLNFVWHVPCVSVSQDHAN